MVATEKLDRVIGALRLRREAGVVRYAAEEGRFKYRGPSGVSDQMVHQIFRKNNGRLGQIGTNLRGSMQHTDPEDPIHKLAKAALLEGNLTAASAWWDALEDSGFLEGTDQAYPGARHKLILRLMDSGYSADEAENAFERIKNAEGRRKSGIHSGGDVDPNDMVPTYQQMLEAPHGVRISRGNAFINKKPYRPRQPKPKPEPAPETPPEQPDQPQQMARVVRRYAEQEHSSQEVAFHQAMEADPENQTNPLVYADWLEENGRSGDAAIIREHVRGHEAMVAHRISHGDKHVPPVQLVKTYSSEYGPLVGLSTNYPELEGRHDLLRLHIPSLATPGSHYRFSGWFNRAEAHDILHNFAERGVKIKPEMGQSNLEYESPERILPSGPPRPDSEQYARMVKRYAQEERVRVDIKGQPYIFTKNEWGWGVVPGSNQINRIGRSYQVTCDETGNPTKCSCPDQFYRGGICKHMRAVMDFRGQAEAQQAEEGAKEESKPQEPAKTDDQDRQKFARVMRYASYRIPAAAAAPLVDKAQPQTPEEHIANIESNQHSMWPALHYAAWLRQNGQSEAAEVITQHVRDQKARQGGAVPGVVDPQEVTGLPAGNFFVKASRSNYTKGTNLVLKQAKAGRPGTVTWMAEVPDPDAERIVRGLAYKGARVSDNSDIRPEVKREATQLARHYAAYRAPAGGIAVRGTYYKGGKLIPDLQKFLPPERLERIQKRLKKKPSVNHMPVVKKVKWVPGQAEFDDSTSKYARAVRRMARNISGNLLSLFRAAQQNPKDETLHGAIADAIEEEYPNSPFPNMIRGLYPTLTGGEPREPNLWEPEFERGPHAGTVSGYRSSLGMHEPFDLYLQHEIPQSSYASIRDRMPDADPADARWIIHAMADVGGGKYVGYNFEYPHQNAHSMLNITQEIPHRWVAPEETAHAWAAAMSPHGFVRPDMVEEFRHREAARFEHDMARRRRDEEHFASRRPRGDE